MIYSNTLLLTTSSSSFLVMRVWTHAHTHAHLPRREREEEEEEEEGAAVCIYKIIYKIDYIIIVQCTNFVYIIDV